VHHRQATLVIPALGELRDILVKLGLQRLGDESLHAFAQHVLNKSCASGWRSGTTVSFFMVA
jgi:hypothetical protein